MELHEMVVCVVVACGTVESDLNGSAQVLKDNRALSNVEDGPGGDGLDGTVWGTVSKACY